MIYLDYSRWLNVGRWWKFWSKCLQWWHVKIRWWVLEILRNWWLRNIDLFPHGCWDEIFFWVDWVPKPTVGPADVRPIESCGHYIDIWIFKNRKNFNNFEQILALFFSKCHFGPTPIKYCKKWFSWASLAPEDEFYLFLNNFW